MYSLLVHDTVTTLLDEQLVQNGERKLGDDAATKTLTMKGKMTDCTTDGQSDVRETMTFPDDKHQHMEMFYAGADGKEMKAMEINYTKK